MEEFKFTEKDADYVCVTSTPTISIAKANKLLAEHLDKCPTVYMVKTEGYRDIWSDKHIPGLDTHECKLFNIKTITEGDNC